MCREIMVEVWGRLQVWGSVDPLCSEVVISSTSFCTVSRPISPLLVVCSREQGALRPQSLLVIRRSGVMNLDGCCSVPELHVRCSFVVVTYSWKISDVNLVTVEVNFFMVLTSSFHEIMIEQRCALKLGLRGVMSFNCECIFCILETRLANEQAEDGDSRSFGLIRRWQVREPWLLIPRYDGRERFLLGSVKHPQDLQPNIPNLMCICPLDCWESRWLYGWLALLRHVEDSSCGFVSVFSTDLPSDSSCSLPRLRLDVFTVLVTKLCNNALAYALFMKVV